MVPKSMSPGGQSRGLNLYGENCITETIFDEGLFAIVLRLVDRPVLTQFWDRGGGLVRF